MTAARQVALVTGASSGIGKASAIALATAGFQVIGTGRNTARFTAPAGVTYLDLDVTNDESVASVVKQVIDRFGHIDVLVNNAGVGATGAAEEFSIAQTQDVFDINVYGVMRMTKAVLPHMRAQRRGRIMSAPSTAASSTARAPSWPAPGWRRSRPPRPARRGAVTELQEVGQIFLLTKQARPQFVCTSRLGAGGSGLVLLGSPSAMDSSGSEFP